MDFTLSSEQIALQKTVRKYAKTELSLIAAEIEKNGIPLSKEILKQFSHMGFLGVNIPKKYGGLV